MHEKILEIIVYILSEIKNSKEVNEIDLKKLNKDGYTEAEINTAFAWIISKIDIGVKLFEEHIPESRSHRFFHDAEKNILTTEAMGFLIQMKELGVITDADSELIIDKVFLSGYQKAGIEEIKMIMSALIFESDKKPGLMSSIILQNNETIH